MPDSPFNLGGKQSRAKVVTGRLAKSSASRRRNRQSKSLNSLKVNVSCMLGRNNNRGGDSDLDADSSQSSQDPKLADIDGSFHILIITIR